MSLMNLDVVMSAVEVSRVGVDDENDNGCDAVTAVLRQGRKREGVTLVLVVVGNIEDC